MKNVTFSWPFFFFFKRSLLHLCTCVRGAEMFAFTIRTRPLLLCVRARVSLIRKYYNMQIQRRRKGCFETRPYLVSARRAQKKAFPNGEAMQKSLSHFFWRKSKPQKLQKIGFEYLTLFNMIETPFLLYYYVHIVRPQFSRPFRVDL